MSKNEVLALFARNAHNSQELAKTMDHRCYCCCRIHPDAMCYIPEYAIGSLACHQRKYEVPMIIGFLAETYKNLTTDIEITVKPFIHMFWRLKLSKLARAKSKKGYH